MQSVFVCVERPPLKNCVLKTRYCGHLLVGSPKFHNHRVKFRGGVNALLFRQPFCGKVFDRKQLDFRCWDFRRETKSNSRKHQYTPKEMSEHPYTSMRIMYS